MSSLAGGEGPFVNISGTSGACSVVDPGPFGGDDNLTRLTKGDPLHILNPRLLQIQLIIISENLSLPCDCRQKI